MELRQLQRITPYAVIAVGAALAFAAAVVPHFTAGYRLLAGVLLSGLLPYLVYALAVPLLRNMLTITAGLILLGAQTALVIAERFTGPVDYSDGFIYFGPWLLALALLPLVALGLKQPWGTEPPANATPPSTAH